MAQLSGSGLDSPGKMLEMISKSSGSGDEPPLEELLESLQTMQAGLPGAMAGPAPAADDQLEMFPEPGFVIKTANEQGAKVFINMCGTTKLPLPLGWEKVQVPAEVKHHLEARLGGEAPPSMRLPLSLVPPRLDKDHEGHMCMVMDCITSSEVLACCSKYRPLKFFLIQLTLGTAAQMTGLELNPQYKLPKMRYKGELPPPPARVRPKGNAGAGIQQQRLGSGAGAKRLIVEVPAEDEEPSFALLASKRQQWQRGQEQAAAATMQPAAVPRGDGTGRESGSGTVAATAEQAVQPTAVSKQLEQQMQQQLEKLHAQVEYHGKPATAVTITVPLPAAAAAAARHDSRVISTSVCAEMVRVQAPGCQPLHVHLPFAVSAVGGSAELVAGGGKGGGSLVLLLPYRPFSSVLEELQQTVRVADGHSSPMSSSLSELD